MSAASRFFSRDAALFNSFGQWQVPAQPPFVLVAGMGAAGVLCFVGMMIAVGVGVKNKPTSQIICGSGIRTAGNTAKQLDASLRKGGLGTGTNPVA